MTGIIIVHIIGTTLNKFYHVEFYHFTKLTFLSLLKVCNDLQRFSGVFRGHKMGTWIISGLNIKLMQMHVQSKFSWHRPNWKCANPNLTKFVSVRIPTASILNIRKTAVGANDCTWLIGLSPIDHQTFIKYFS